MCPALISSAALRAKCLAASPDAADPASAERVEIRRTLRYRPAAARRTLRDGPGIRVLLWIVAAMPETGWYVPSVAALLPM